MRRRRSEAGFTLVELLVAMGLLALAAVMVAQGFGVDRASLRRVQSRAEDVESVAAAQDLLRDRIEHLFPAVRFDSEGPKVRFAGSAEQADFLTTGRMQGGDRRPVHRVLVDLTTDGDLEMQQLASQDDPPVVEGRELLLRRVRGLSLDYFGSVRPGAPAGWRADWTGSSMTPELVRMRVAFADGDRRTWPELIVRPAAQVDTACILDPATLSCRGRG